MQDDINLGDYVFSDDEEIDLTVQSAPDKHNYFGNMTSKTYSTNSPTNFSNVGMPQQSPFSSTLSTTVHNISKTTSDPDPKNSVYKHPWSRDIRKALKTFGLKSFREHQEEAINAVLAGNDVFILMV